MVTEINRYQRNQTLNTKITLKGNSKRDLILGFNLRNVVMDCKILFISTYAQAKKKASAFKRGPFSWSYLGVGSIRSTLYRKPY